MARGVVSHFADRLNRAAARPARHRAGVAREFRRNHSGAARSLVDGRTDTHNEAKGPREMNPLFTFTSNPWIDFTLAIVVAILVALAVHAVGAAALVRFLRSSPSISVLVRHARAPARWILVLLALQAVFEAASPELTSLAGLRHVATLLLIVCVTWLAAAAVDALTEIVLLLNPSDVADNLHARQMRTQANVIGRTLKVFVLIFGVAAALSTFPSVRQFGTTLLASAGAAGIIVGFAARPVLGNVLAGLQIALTQPIRIDDVLIVEGEWGRVAEITGSYVVFQIWDERRLIVPLQWFIQNPFQNWTRTSAQIIGSVFFWADYRMPVPKLREEFLRLCKQYPEWDGRVASLDVTDSNERAMQVRVIASSADASRNWDLRCKLREALIEFMQREYPAHLPRIRATAEVEAIPGAGGELAAR